MSLHDAETIARRFVPPGESASVVPFVGGHINASYLIALDDQPRYLLQRINEHVFPRPELVAANVERVVEHVAPPGDPSALVPRLAPADDGARHVRDAAGGWWRSWEFVLGTETRQAPTRVDEAYDAARAFGDLQRRLSTLPGPRLAEPIPGFHDTRARLRAFERAVESDLAGRVPVVQDEIAALVDRASLVDALPIAVHDGALTERIVHNDAKLANVLFDARTGAVQCVVDLDTVMPGLGPYDFGDLARSMAADATEDERELARVVARPDFVEALAAGFLAGLGQLATRAERGLLLPAAAVITYEQALRFLADYLSGDRYYRVSHPEQNLDRARTQIALLASFEAQSEELERRIGAI